ncbi:Spo0B C-terminal domain-containing protein [Neobacillus sp. LXY-1]|uniref:Spo0B C-terminal domain-containing protein n=1 Tax=Neobacillus sp. LXY-1 TaxID=3379133 RepID=UPI003EE29E2F
MEKQWNLIEVLRHSRHDWLNKLQIIKGNLDLNRIERTKEVINEIIIEAQHETNLSNLHIPCFAEVLLKTNWETHSFLLDYEVLQDTEVAKINDVMITDWTTSFFSCLDQAIETFHENHLSITIKLEPEGFRFFFDFSGIIRSKELIEKFLKTPNSVELGLVTKEFTESELAFEVFMPKL